MARFKQTEEKYKHIYLGFGSGTIYSYGCYLVSLVNGLNDKGYNFTPEGFNDFLKQNTAFVGEFANYIDVERLDDILPNIFTSFRSVDPWNDKPLLDELIRPNLIVLGCVDAKAIGGTGSHYVLLTGKDGNVAIVHDPWTGREEKITVRWGKLGNIKSVRIFDIKPFTAPQEPNDAEKNAFQHLLTEFKNLPQDDELRNGNLEGYARAITEEHKHYKEYEAKTKILDGFINKWLGTLMVATTGSYTEQLHRIEDEISKLLTKEDSLELYQDGVRDFLSIFLTKDTLDLITEDDKKVLEELKGTKGKIDDLKISLTKCETKLEKAQAKNVILEIPFRNYMIRVVKISK